MAISKIPSKVKTVEISGTTDNAGRIKLFDGKKYVVGVQCTNYYVYGVPYITPEETATYLMCSYFSNGSPNRATEQNVVFQITYLN